MAAAIEQLRAEGSLVQAEDVVPLSPARFEHVKHYGKYTFDVDDTGKKLPLRPLRTRD
jgi:hypothetical protein